MSRSTNPALAAKLEAERRLKEGISGHRTGLPKKLLDLFAPLDPPAQLTPLKQARRKPYTGVAQYVGEFAEPKDPEYEPAVPEECPASPRLYANPELPAQCRLEVETRHERRLRVAKEQIAKAKYQIEEGLKDWDPAKDPTATGDPFKTLFVARVSFEATERKLKREFEEYGPVKSIRLVHDKNDGKSRGYAFIEYEHKNDMKLAYKMADGKKIEGKRVVVDVERGRTVPNWRPRRFGGGKGGESREAKLSKKRPPVPSLAAAIASTLATPDRQTDGGDKDRERDKERARTHEKERERGREPDRSRIKDVDLSRVPPPSAPLRADRDREVNGKRESSRDRDMDRRDRDRKRDRADREERMPGERDRDDSNRSTKRHRDDRHDHRSRDRRRERDLL